MKLRDVNGPGEGVEKTPQIIESEVPSADQRDAEVLARLGKKPVLKVRTQCHAKIFSFLDNDRR